MRNPLLRLWLKLYTTFLGWARLHVRHDQWVTLEAALRRCRSRNIPVTTVIDVGASNGVWSEACLRFFPTAFYFLVEAQRAHEQKLLKFKGRHVRSDFVISAAGDQVGEVFFDDSGLFGGVASHTPQEGYVRYPVTTIDTLVAERQLTPPFLLKLDTHGFEIPIFEGACESLKQTSLIVVEAYNFNLNEKAVRFTDLCIYLEKKGFRCVDMCDPMFRPKDGVFWQFDLFFVPSSAPVFLSNSYK